MEKLTIDFSPLVSVMQGFSDFIEKQLVSARNACQLNQVHQLISGKHRCAHYVSSDKLHLLSNQELICWVKIRIKLQQVELAKLGMVEVEKRSLEIDERLNERQSLIN